MRRREFLLLGVARALAQPDLRFPDKPRDRLAVASYPFRAFINAPGNYGRKRSEPGMELTQFPAMVVEKFGVHNIEPLDVHFASTEPAYLERLRAAVEKAGSHVVNIPAGVGASVYDTNAARREKAIANGKKWIDVAAAVGSPSVRIHIQGARGVAPDPGRAAATLETIADYGGKKGIIVNLENDDLVTEDAFFLVQVIEKVNSPWLRALPDFGNSMLKGDEKFNYEAVAAMFRHARNIAHVKDSEVDRGKVFRVDVGRTFAIAKAAGYRGWFSMEWEGEGEPYQGTRKLIEDSLRYLA